MYNRRKKDFPRFSKTLDEFNEGLIKYEESAINCQKTFDKKRTNQGTLSNRTYKYLDIPVS